MMAEEAGYWRTQSDIVYSIFGNTNNQSGDVSQQASALKKISSSTFANADYDNCQTTTQFTKWVVNSLEDDKAVSIACCPVGTLNTGHSYLAYGVDTNNTYVKLIDSWNGATDRIRISRNALLNGFYCVALNQSVESVSAVHY